MIELGGLVVRDVDAVVLPDEALSETCSACVPVEAEALR